jgi:hypothetical protein
MRQVFRKSRALASVLVAFAPRLVSQRFALQSLRSIHRGGPRHRYAQEGEPFAISSVKPGIFQALCENVSDERPDSRQQDPRGSEKLGWLALGFKCVMKRAIAVDQTGAKTFGSERNPYNQT